MLKLAICEDRQEDLNYLEQHLKQFLTKETLDFTITTFTSGKSMLEVLEKRQFDLYFIDIYLDEVNGILLAEKIRLTNKEAAIVFTTSSAHHMAEGYQLGILHYLLKPFTREDIKESLRRALRVIQVKDRSIEVMVERIATRIFHKQIQYVEFRNRYCTLFTDRGDKVVYCSLNELEDQLDDPRFLRCHRSFLINMDEVIGMKTRDFLMSDGREIPMSREHAKKLREAYAKYKINRVREER